MTRDRSLDALRRLDRPIAPSPEADANIRTRIDAAIDQDLGASVPRVQKLHPDVGADVGVVDRDSGRPTKLRQPAWKRVPTLVGLAAACLALVFFATTLDDDEEVGVVTTPILQQSFERAACGRVFDRYATVWQDATAAGKSVPGQPMFSNEEFSAIVAAQDEWLSAVSLAASASPGTLTSEGTAALGVAIQELASTKYAFDVVRGDATHPPNLVDAIRQTQAAVRELIAAAPVALAGCDPLRLAWPD